MSIYVNYKEISNKDNIYLCIIEDYIDSKQIVKEKQNKKYSY